MNSLLLATRNAGKLSEYMHAFASIDVHVIGLDQTDLPHTFDVEEPAMTMEGNALIKAIMYGNATGRMTLSEDAGLEVDALDGRPGVYSARYMDGTDEDRYRRVLSELQGVSEEDRGAQFRVVIALYDPVRQLIRTCEGVQRGKILREPRGEGGFGYDPIFLCERTQKTNAELTPAEKFSVSHRGHALRKALEVMREDFQ